jgi:hypothetical protein
LIVESKTIKLFAGLTMEFLFKVVILGINNPLELLVISRIELESGFVVFIPAFCAQEKNGIPIISNNTTCILLID